MSATNTVNPVNPVNTAKAVKTNMTPARMLATLGTPPLAHYPVSPRVNSAHSEGADLIEPVATLCVSIQAGIAWGHFLGHVPETVRALDFQINAFQYFFAIYRGM